MNAKLLTGCAIAVAAGVLIYTQTETSSASIELAQLDYVPADTPLFYGQLKPFPYSKYFDLLPEQMKGADDLTPLIENLTTNNNKNAQFLASLLTQYQASLSSYDALKAAWGFADDYKGLAYTIGLMPVLRYQLDDETALFNTINSSADKAGINFTTKTIEGVNYTTYPLVFEDDITINLIVSVKDKWATITFDTKLNTSDDLRLALAIDKPSKSLTQTNKLNNYIAKYSFDGHSVAYIDHVEIANAITAKTPSRLGDMLDELLQQLGNPQAFDIARTPQCQNDITNLVSYWPASVTGSTYIQVTNSDAHFKADAILQSTATDIIKTLKSVRGFVPEHTTQLDGQMLSFAYGADISKIPPLINILSSAFKKAEFECAPLVDLQQQTQDTNLAALSMMTAMANGIQGVSLSVQDLVLEADANQQPQLKAFDALITLSATDPDNLLFTAKGFLPALADIEIPENGGAVSINTAIPYPLPAGLDIKLAKKGKHLVLFTGEKSATIANTLSEQALEKNGFLNTAVDLNSLMTPVINVFKMTGQVLPEQLDQLKNQTMSVYFATDIKDEGIVVNSEIKITKE
ncbi:MULTISPECIES: hypothetical protein [Pseudoalteromonas]|uniref:DUF3352 domain-containing protein n=1 Tax=Pseudoalteromonas porphyrae TaxID=187330 RepID=A0A0N1F0W5_9GAMM|nr:hypothetical protein [Pseudoalteromonas porphyrae]KPH65694.1 hypothetical protein ADS77_01855 [Pseudoalteromonas porphyrae]